MLNGSNSRNGDRSPMAVFCLSGAILAQRRFKHTYRSRNFMNLLPCLSPCFLPDVLLDLDVPSRGLIYDDPHASLGWQRWWDMFHRVVGLDLDLDPEFGLRAVVEWVFQFVCRDRCCWWSQLFELHLVVDFGVDLRQVAGCSVWRRCRCGLVWQD